MLELQKFRKIQLIPVISWSISLSIWPFVTNCIVLLQHSAIHNNHIQHLSLACLQIINDMLVKHIFNYLKSNYSNSINNKQHPCMWGGRDKSGGVWKGTNKNHMWQATLIAINLSCNEWGVVFVKEKRKHTSVTSWSRYVCLFTFIWILFRWKCRVLHVQTNTNKKYSWNVNRELVTTVEACSTYSVSKQWKCSHPLKKQRNHQTIA